MNGIEITHRYTKAVLYSGKHATTKDAVEAAVAARANLVGANLARADLVGANLDGAKLDGANLFGAKLDGAKLARANLFGANLDGAYLVGAYLVGANLARANLVGANLARADLDGADLDGANLVRANFDGATINWKSHWLLSELLWRKADSPTREQLAAWIGRKIGWCWKEWIKLDHPDRAWALETLKTHVRDGDNAPDILRSPAKATGETGGQQACL